MNCSRHCVLLERECRGKSVGMWILMGGIFLPKILHLFSLLVVQQFIYHQLKLKLPYTSSYLMFTQSQTIRNWWRNSGSVIVLVGYLPCDHDIFASMVFTHSDWIGTSHVITIPCTCMIIYLLWQLNKKPHSSISSSQVGKWFVALESAWNSASNSI